MEGSGRVEESEAKQNRSVAWIEKFVQKRMEKSEYLRLEEATLRHSINDVT